MLSSSGFRDALGERDLRFNRESGQVYERLLLRPELSAYGSALERRVGRLATLEDPRLVAVESVEPDIATRRMAVVSRHVSGQRLEQILDAARTHEVVPDLTVALHLTAELLVAVQRFQCLSGLPHGAIAPSRVILTPEGEILLTDYAYAEVIEAARFSPTRLWREFGIASWSGEPFSFAGDVRQCALAGMALILGRRLDPAASEHIDPVLSEVEEAAMIRGGRLLADPVMEWFRQAVAAGSADGFQAAEDAAEACAELLTERERWTARESVVQFLAELDAPPVEATPLAPDPFAEPAPLPEFESITGTEAAAESSGSDLDRSPDLSFDVPDFTSPGPEFMPVSEFDSPPGDLPPLSDADLFAIPDLPPAEMPAVDVPEPALAASVQAQPAAGHPAPARPAQPAPAFEVTPDAGPRVVSVSPFAVAENAARAAASAAPAIEPALPMVPAPAIAVPLPVPLPRVAPTFPPPPLVAPATPPGPPAIQLKAGTPVQLKSDTAIRLKTEEPIRLKDPAPRKRSHDNSLHLDLTDRPAVDGDEGESGSSFPWKYVAAGLVVLVVGAGAFFMDWGTTTAKTETAKPVEAPAPPPATTGSIEVISNSPGSRVLVDGKSRGVTPITVEDLKPGRHIVLVRAPNGNVRRTVIVKAGETTKLDLAVYSGWIVVNAPVELQILERGKVLGSAGEGPIVLGAGHHTIEVANAALEYRATHEVDIEPGEEQRLDLNPKGLANLNAVPWAEVWLDGTKLGDTPLGNVSVPLGMREFVFKHPQFGDRKVAVTITGSAPAQVSVDYTK